MTTREDTTADAARAALATTPAPKTGTDLRQVAEQLTGAIERALPMEMDAARFVRIAQTQLSLNPDLKLCTRESFMGAMLSAAQLGLEFGPLQQAYMIPRKSHGRLQVNFQIGYKGWLALAHRSEKLSSIICRTVHENDHFKYAYGLEDVFEHVPTDDEPGAATHYYCIAKIRNGAPILSVMSKVAIMGHRDKYAPRNAQKQIVGPWVEHFDAMALKTVFKSVFTWLPMSAEMGMAAAVDERFVKREDLEHEPEIEFDEDEEIVEGEVVDDAALESDDRVGTCQRDGHLGFHAASDNCINWFPESEAPEQ